MTKDQNAKQFSLGLRILFLFFCGTAAVALSLFFYGSNNAIEIVENQLKALKSHHISEAYYEYTAREFQNTTSLPQFREFLKAYPVLSNSHAYQLEMAGMKKKHAYVIGRLVSQDFDEMKAEWTLIKEDGEWKVAALKLAELPKKDKQQLVMQEMVDFVKKQLQLLRDKDFVEAYYGFVSKDFQNETSLSSFETFVKNNPILFSYRSLNVDDARVDNDRGYLTLSLEGPKGKYLLEYILSPELGSWKIFGLHLILPDEEAAEKAAENPETLVPPVRKFLDALAALKVDKAYQLTSKEFRDSTTIENFKKFVNTYPALNKRELIDIKRGKIENGAGTLFVNLHDQNGVTELEFHLGFFEGEWMIWGIEVLHSPKKAENSAESLNVENQPHLAEHLFDLLRQQRIYLSHQDINEAYELTMSAGYRQHHSIDQFKIFFNKFPVLLDYRSSYINRFFRDKNRVVLRGYLTTFDQGTLPVRFDFIEELDGWKIDRMALLDKHDPIAEAEEVFDKPAEDHPPRPLKILSIVMGTAVDNRGLVKNPVKELDPNVNLVFFNVHIVNGKPRTLVTLFVEHVDSDTSAPPLSTMLEKKGESVVSFSYAAPRKGWPPGNYIAKVTTTTGQEALFKFIVGPGASYTAFPF